MNEEKIRSIVSSFRETCEISDEEVGEVVYLCERKMQLAGKCQDYIIVLLPDELRNFYIRKIINTIAVLNSLKKGGITDGRGYDKAVFSNSTERY